MVGRPISLPLQFGLAFRAIQGYIGFRVEGLGYRVQGYTGFRYILLYDTNGETECNERRPTTSNHCRRQVSYSCDTGPGPRRRFWV